MIAKSRRIFVAAATGCALVICASLLALYTSVSPFSAQPFQGNDVAATWHKDLGKGALSPSQEKAAP